MRLIKLAAAVLNQTPLDWHGNKARIVQAIEESRRQGATVLCLPELCITGYGCEDAFHSPSVHRTAWRILHAGYADHGCFLAGEHPQYQYRGREHPW